MKISRHIKQFFSHRYLVQLIATCIVFLLIPCVLALYFTMYHSYQKLQVESQEYYMTSAKNYFDCFMDEINSMITLSNQISSDSRIIDRPAYALRPNLIGKSPYYFSEAAEGISFYHNNVSSALTAIYYPQEDWLITYSHKYTARSYVENVLQIADSKSTDEICAFLSNDTEEKVSMYSLYPQNIDSGFLLMRVSTYVGSGKAPAVLLYRLDESYLQTSFLASVKSVDLQFSVFDGESGELLLSSGSRNAELSSDSFDFDPTEMKQGKSYSIDQGGQKYTCFFIYNETMNFYYGVIGPYDAIYCTSLSYFKTMQFVIGGSILVLLMLLVILIYINYRPIYALMQKVRPHTRDSDLLTISTAIDSMTDELNELNVLLKDYLLENILRGRPINETLTNRLGIAKHQGDYRVYALSGISLNTEERTTLTEKLLGSFAVPSFITDILIQNITVIICLIPKNDGTGTTAYLRAWLSDRHPEAVFYEGSIVTSINQLQESYLACGILDKAESGKTELQKRQEARNAQAAEKAAQLAQEILKYLQENFCDPCLSQTTIADLFHISTYTLSRLFKDQFGIGFAEFISGRRMEYAKQLLLTTDAQVGEIAVRVGLPNLNYFSRLFKTTTGVSPTKYRTQNSTGPASTVYNEKCSDDDDDDADDDNDACDDEVKYNPLMRCT